MGGSLVLAPWPKPEATRLLLVTGNQGSRNIAGVQTLLLQHRFGCGVLTGERLLLLQEVLLAYVDSI